jgi:hypothetical protein
VRSVKLSQIEAESKRLVLAFESRLAKELNWALNTLALFSCNTSQNFTLENQPYLLDSMANYLVYCIQHVESLAYTDPFEKRGKTIGLSVSSYVEASASSDAPPLRQLDYRNFGAYSSKLLPSGEQKRARDMKLEEKKVGGPKDPLLDEASA